MQNSRRYSGAPTFPNAPKWIHGSQNWMFVFNLTWIRALYGMFEQNSKRISPHTVWALDQLFSLPLSLRFFLISQTIHTIQFVSRIEVFTIRLHWKISYWKSVFALDLKYENRTRERRTWWDGKDRWSVRNNYCWDEMVGCCSTIVENKLFAVGKSVSRPHCVGIQEIQVSSTRLY